MNGDKGGHGVGRGRGTFGTYLRVSSTTWDGDRDTRCGSTNGGLPTKGHRKVVHLQGPFSGRTKCQVHRNKRGGYTISIREGSTRTTKLGVCRRGARGTGDDACCFYHHRLFRFGDRYQGGGQGGGARQVGRTYLGTTYIDGTSVGRDMLRGNLGDTGCGTVLCLQFATGRGQLFKGHETRGCGGHAHGDGSCSHGGSLHHHIYE